MGSVVPTRAVAYARGMTPREKAIVEALVAVAWADGELQAPEAGVIEGLLSGFDASPEEEREILEWAQAPRSLRDVSMSQLDRDDKELLLGNAALLVQADGVESPAEHALIKKLATILELPDDDTREIVASVRDGARRAHRG